jgi:cell division protein FtsI (penicillin-binding protein 3)
MRPAFGLPEVRRRRLGWLATVAALGFVGLAARSAQLQVLQRVNLPPDAGQHVDVAALGPLRGDIVDRDGQQLATSLPRPTVVANPGAMSPAERARTARALARLLRVPSERLGVRLRSNGRGVKLARGITDEQAEAVRKRALPHVTIELERLRVYPS